MVSVAVADKVRLTSDFGSLGHEALADPLRGEMEVFVQNAFHEYIASGHGKSLGGEPEADAARRVLRDACVWRLAEEGKGLRVDEAPMSGELIDRLECFVKALGEPCFAVNGSRLPQLRRPKSTLRRVGGGWQVPAPRSKPRSRRELQNLYTEVLHSAESLQHFVHDPAGVMHGDRLQRDRARQDLHFVTDAVQLQVRLNKIVATRPYLEHAKHPLNYWLARCRADLSTGQVLEASDHLDRIVTALKLDDQRLKAAYAKFDHDGSGALEVSEFRHFAVYVGFGTEAVDAALRASDHDANGLISLAEFAHFVGSMGGVHALFEQRRQLLSETSDHAGIEPGSRVRAHFRSKGRKSVGVWDAMVERLSADGCLATVKFDMGKLPLTQKIPREWIEEDVDMVEALREIGIVDDAQHYWTILLPLSDQQVVKTLVGCQRAAIEHVRTMATSNHNRMLPELMARTENLGISQEQLWAMLTWIRDLAPVIIHVNLDVVGPFLEADTHYRNQFETKSSCGYLSEDTRVSWERDLFGGAYDDSMPFERPKYGVLDVMNDYRGVLCADQYGDSYLVLKSARLRCTFAPEDSGGICGSRLAVLDQYAHVLLEYDDRELREVARVASAPMGSEDRIGDSNQLASYNYKEAQIHGELDLGKHIKRLVVNERHRVPRAQFREAQIQALCEKHGWELVWMSDERTRRIFDERKGVANRAFEVRANGEVLTGTEEPDATELSSAIPEDGRVVTDKLPRSTTVGGQRPSGNIIPEESHAVAGVRRFACSLSGKSSRLGVGALPIAEREQLLAELTCNGLVAWDRDLFGNLR